MDIWHALLKITGYHETGCRAEETGDGEVQIEARKFIWDLSFSWGAG
jgi:hypothetical protein